MNHDSGVVYLVGAGPGDPGLLTLRGAELLGRAEVIIYDALVNSDLLRLAPPDAEIIYAGKRARQHALVQDELNALLIDRARTGKCVIRLKGGDPYIFGRGGEEAEALADAHVPFEVVPGISSIVAAPNYAGIPLTHRDHSSTFTVFTGHEDPAKEGTSLNWPHLAGASGTKVILMGAEKIGQLAESLISHGMKAATPVAMVRWGTTGRQQSIQGTLGTIAELATAKNFTAPAVTVIGGVVHLRDKLNWFERRPLFGQRIVVTRTRAQASELSRQLRELGADILEVPTIRIAPPTERTPLVEALSGLSQYDWLVFTSPNGVTAFFDYFFKAFPDIRDLGALRIAAVGPATAAKVREFHLTIDLMPSEFLTREIVKSFADYQSIENMRILLMRAEVANLDLPKGLEDLGAIVDDVACYQTVPEEEDRNGAAAVFREEGADWITFTSSSTVENFHARFNLPEMMRKFPEMKLASIGPETSKALAQLSAQPEVEAKVHTIPGLVDVIQKHPRTLAALV